MEWLIDSPPCIIVIFINHILVYFQCCDICKCIIDDFSKTCIRNLLFRIDNCILILFLRDIHFIDTCRFILILIVFTCIFGYLVIINTSTHTWICNFRQIMFLNIHTCILNFVLNSYSPILVYLCWFSIQKFSLFIRDFVFGYHFIIEWFSFK